MIDFYYRDVSSLGILLCERHVNAVVKEIVLFLLSSQIFLHLLLSTYGFPEG